MKFRLLGPVEMWAGGRRVDAGQPRQRLVLAALLVDAGRVVPTEVLVDRVWGDALPRDARGTLNAHLSRIRRALTDASDHGVVQVIHRSGGYVIDVDPAEVDALRWRELVERARDPGCVDGQRVVVLREAVGLWHDEPLAGLFGAWAARTRLAWQHVHLDTMVAWADAELRSGEPATVIGPLIELTGDHPLAESPIVVLMRAMHASGRTGDALDLYTSIRRRLVDELGTDPGSELQAVHQQILRGQDSRIPQPATHPPAGRSPARALLTGDRSALPRQLPAAVPHFAGRAAELAVLDGLVEDQAEAHSPVVISAIGGTPGVGKTALALYWAHRVADRFPDGQLYLNLRGFDPTGSVLEPAEAVRRFLDALDVPPRRIPADLDAQAALYRSELAGRRVLIVLDNARDAAQVRPLLPGTPTCLVLVTSRNQLTGLVAADGAHPITLDLLPAVEAGQLLARRLGPDRVNAEPEAVEEIINHCARLPLALAIVAARASINPHLQLHTFAGDLRETRDRLDALTGDDPHTDVRAVFSWSYRALSPNAARLFRLLGLHPGPDITGPAAASLAALPPPQASPLLAELTRMNLLVEHTPGRYSFHDLLRAYATHLTHRLDPDHHRHTATHRMLDHYLHTAHTADRLLYPHRDPITLTSPRSGVTPEHPTDHRHARAWFTAEHPVLLAVIDHAATTGFDSHTWQLAWTLWTYLDRRGLWHDQTTSQTTAFAAAERLADPTAQAHAHCNLASADTWLGRFNNAIQHLQRALHLFGQTNDLVGQAWTHIGLGIVYEHQARHAEALHHGRQALDLYRAAGHRHGQARALNAVGWRHALLGDHQQALVYCQQSLTRCQELDDRDGQVNAWHSLGYAHHHLGHHTQALTCYQHALDIRRDVGNRYQEALVLTNLGDTHDATNNTDGARTAWQRALTILTDLNHPDAEHLRTKLATLPTTK